LGEKFLALVVLRGYREEEAWTLFTLPNVI
jgi:hypothetical protein